MAICETATNLCTNNQPTHNLVYQTNPVSFLYHKACHDNNCHLNVPSFVSVNIYKEAKNRKTGRLVFISRLFLPTTDGHFLHVPKLKNLEPHQIFH
jgi:hypothetical protein